MSYLTRLRDNTKNSELYFRSDAESQTENTIAFRRRQVSYRKPVIFNAKTRDQY